MSHFYTMPSALQVRQGCDGDADLPTTDSSNQSSVRDAAKSFATQSRVMSSDVESSTPVTRKSKLQVFSSHLVIRPIVFRKGEKHDH